MKAKLGLNNLLFFGRSCLDAREVFALFFALFGALSIIGGSLVFLVDFHEYGTKIPIL
jgi:hypothetical protein